MASDFDSLERVSQRTVPARAVASLAKTGPSSVFDLIKPAKKPTAPPPSVDFSAIAIQLDVALPAQSRRQVSRYDALLSRLAVDASAELPLEHACSLRIAMRMWSKRHPGQKFTSRKVSETSLRLWRTE